ncbi:MAG: hypothetical protein RIR51_1839, partial [Bacteroidota bacterium]
LNFTFKNENFTFNFSEAVFNEFKNYLNEKNLKQLDKNLLAIKNKLDSINYELNKYINISANQSDNSLGLVLNSDKIDQKKNLMKVEMLSQMFVEATKQYETYSALQNTSRIELTTLYKPTFPLKNQKKPIYLYIILSFFLVNFFTIVTIILRNFFINHIK